LDAKVGRLSATSSRGRPFAKGNAGRKPGAKNKTTLVAEALLRDEETELVRKAIELAKAGNVPMLKLFLERILPRERAVRVELPKIESAADAANAFGAIIDAVGVGSITPSEAAALASLLTDFARAKNVAELEERLENVEETLGAILGENADGSKSTKTNFQN
jgi:hypothetical protein